MRKRGNHSVAVKNKEPVYVRPSAYRNRPFAIKDLQKACLKQSVPPPHERGVTKQALIKAGRLKSFKKSSGLAFDALLVGIADHINLLTWQVEKSFKGLSDCCGLTTESDKGNVSISRTSRAIKLMKDMGLIYWDDKDQIWDAELGQWIAKVFYVTEDFFVICGLTTERFEKERNKRLFLVTDKMSRAAAGKVSVASIRRQRRIEYIRNCFESRSNKQAVSKLRRAAKKAQEKEEHNIVLLAQKRVLKALDHQEIAMMSASEFTHLINKEAAYLRAVASGSDPYNS